MTILRTVVAPVAAPFAVFVVAVWYAVRHPAPRPEVARTDPPSLLRHVLVTVAAGYLAHVAIVVVFAEVLGAEPGVLRSAVRAGAVLAFGVVVPAFVLLSSAEAAVRSALRRRR